MAEPKEEDAQDIFPLFEVELDLNKDEPPLRKAEVEHDSGLHIRCKIRGDDHDPKTMQWLFAGRAPDHKMRIETDHEKYVSSLITSSVETGVYECGVHGKSDGKYYRTRLRVGTKPAQSGPGTITALRPCPKERDGYCQNGGTCLHHTGTGVTSCLCHGDYIGIRCEYFYTGLHNMTGRNAEKVLEDRMAMARAEYQKSISLIAGFSGFLILGLLIAFVLYAKKRDQIKSRFSLRRRMTKNVHRILTTSTTTQQIESVEHQHLHHPLDNLIPRSESETTAVDDSMTPAFLTPAFRPSPSMDERIKLVKSLIPARCPHCKKTLGINGKLDALTTARATGGGSGVSRNSTPPILTYPDSPESRTSDYRSIRSISESHFQSAGGKPSPNHSTPGSYLTVNEFLAPGSRPISRGSFRERRRGVSESLEESDSHRRSISTPVSPMIKVKSLLTPAPSFLSPSSTLEKARPQADEPPAPPQPPPAVARPTLAGIIHEMSVDESNIQDSTALLDALQAYRAQNTSKPVAGDV